MPPYDVVLRAVPSRMMAAIRQPVNAAEEGYTLPDVYVTENVTELQIPVVKQK